MDLRPLPVAQWYEYCKAFALRVDDCKRMLENGENVDVACICHHGNMHMAHASNPLDTPVNPLHYFRNCTFNRIVMVDNKTMKPLAIDNKGNILPWMFDGNHSKPMKIFVESCDDWPEEVLAQYPHLVSGNDRKFDYLAKVPKTIYDYPGNHRVGYNGGAPMIPVKLLANMRSIVRRS